MQSVTRGRPDESNNRQTSLTHSQTMPNMHALQWLTSKSPTQYSNLAIYVTRKTTIDMDSNLSRSIFYHFFASPSTSPGVSLASAASRKVWIYSVCQIKELCGVNPDGKNYWSQGRRRIKLDPETAIKPCWSKRCTTWAKLSNRKRTENQLNSNNHGWQRVEHEL